MRIKKLCVLIFSAVLVGCLCGCRQQGEGLAGKAVADVTAEAAKVESIIGQYIEALTTKDMERLASIFAHDEDLVMFDGNSPARFVGWEAVKERFQSHFDSFDKLDISSSDETAKVHATGEVAWLSCVLDADLFSRGQQASIRGLRVTWALEKRDNHWVIVQAHFSLSGKSE